MGGGLSQLGTKQQQWLAPSGGLGAEERVERVVLPSVFLSLSTSYCCSTLHQQHGGDGDEAQPVRANAQPLVLKLFGERISHSLRVHTRKL